MVDPLTVVILVCFRDDEAVVGGFHRITLDLERMVGLVIMLNFWRSGSMNALHGVDLFSQVEFIYLDQTKTKSQHVEVRFQLQFDCAMVTLDGEVVGQSPQGRESCPWCPWCHSAFRPIIAPKVIYSFSWTFISSFLFHLDLGCFIQKILTVSYSSQVLDFTQDPWILNVSGPTSLEMPMTWTPRNIRIDHFSPGIDERVA